MTKNHQMRLGNFYFGLPVDAAVPSDTSSKQVTTATSPIACSATSVKIFRSRLYAGLAGVENPEDAFHQPPSPRPLSLAPSKKLNRRQPSDRVLRSTPPPSPPTPPSPTPPSPPGVLVGVKRARHSQPLPGELAAAAAAVMTVAVTAGEGRTHLSNGNDAGKHPRSIVPDGSLTRGGEGGAGLRGSGAQSGGSLGQTAVEPSLSSLVQAPTLPEPLNQPKNRVLLYRPGIPQAWRARLKRDLAAGREPSETFQFPALGR